MNQTDQFLNALKDIEEGKIVDLDKALNEEPPKDIDQIDNEREAWKRMFDLQSRLVVGLETDKIKLEKENKKLFEDLQQWKQLYSTLWKKNMMNEKLIKLNMNDFHNVVDQRDWYYEEYRKLKDRLNVA